MSHIPTAISAELDAQLREKCGENDMAANLSAMIRGFAEKAKLGINTGKK